MIIIIASIYSCALEMKIDGIIFWMFAHFVRITTWFLKIFNDIFCVCGRKSNTFVSKWASWIEILYKEGEIIVSEVVDL